jgi:hypothetical protein
MVIIELNEFDLEEAISDSEYFTASEDEYFSADECNSACFSHANPEYLNPFNSQRSVQSNSGYSRSSGLGYSGASGSRYSVQSGSEYSTPSSSGYSKKSGSGYSSFRAKSGRSKTPGDTDWTFDESAPREKYKFRRHIPVEPATMRNYYMWRRLIIAGQHPRNAADMIGSQFRYKQVKQKKDIQLFSIRLSHEHRVFFIIKEQERIVNVLNIGGHSFS